jgi:valyl-tRNA synthetase
MGTSSAIFRVHSVLCSREPLVRKKMSKSLGNVIDPQEVVDGSPNGKPLPKAGFGLDVLRVWAAHQDSTKDIEIGPGQLAKVADAQVSGFLFLCVIAAFRLFVFP